MHLCSISRISKIIVITLLTFSLLSCSSQAGEAQLKAAYLLNFARFVYWPETAFENSKDIIYLCLYKTCPIEKSLRGLSNRTIQNKKISIEVVNTIDELEKCHVVYFSKENEQDNILIMPRLKDRMLLTVSDSPGFFETDGLIEFVEQQGKIKFKINVTKSKNRGITYRSQLLEVADHLK